MPLTFAFTLTVTQIPDAYPCLDESVYRAMYAYGCWYFGGISFMTGRTGAAGHPCLGK